MADDGLNRDNTVWALPAFSFKVNFGNGMGDASFQEVSGLEAETQVIEYRHGDSPVFSNIKMPGLVKFNNVTLKRGILQKSKLATDWLSMMTVGALQLSTVSISLLEGTGNATMTWTLKNAFPVKMQATDLKSDSNEFAIESIELVHEGMTVENN